jgi:hypothetical protein
MTQPAFQPRLGYKLVLAIEVDRDDRIFRNTRDRGALMMFVQ